MDSGDEKRRGFHDAFCKLLQFNMLQKRRWTARRAWEPERQGPSDGVAVRGLVNGRGPRRRRGEDSPEGAYRPDGPCPQATARRARACPSAPTPSGVNPPEPAGERKRAISFGRRGRKGRRVLCATPGACTQVHRPVPVCSKRPVFEYTLPPEWTGGIKGQRGGSGKAGGTALRRGRRHPEGPPGSISP